MYLSTDGNILCDIIIVCGTSLWETKVDLNLFQNRFQRVVMALIDTINQAAFHLEKSVEGMWLSLSLCKTDSFIYKLQRTDHEMNTLRA